MHRGSSDPSRRGWSNGHWARPDGINIAWRDTQKGVK